MRLRGLPAAIVGAAIVALTVGGAPVAGSQPLPVQGGPTALVSTGRPLQTAVQDITGPNPDLALSRIRGAGARALQIVAYWRNIAPAGTQKPPGFVAADPLDPAYRWAALDQEVRAAAAHGLEPIVVVLSAPAWAERTTVGPPGTRNPDPNELAAFASAAALRYSGRLAGLPRVRYWQVWNEPNLQIFLAPQRINGVDVAAARYRVMVNRFTAAVHAIQPDAMVIAGGTAPFGARGFVPPATAPLVFMRELLCMSNDAPPHKTCRARTSFDIWAHHPYTSGGPTHHAQLPDDVSLGDLPEMRQLLLAATRARQINSKRPPLFWVTEFSWDTDPPDPAAVPARLQARWVAEAMYRMWRSGISLVTWFQLRDQPLSTSIFQSGLYYDDGPAYRLDEPKPALAAFRFPFVALKTGRRVLVWGRMPGGAVARVRVQQTIGQGWVTVANVRTNRFGIFQSLLRVPLFGRLRAVSGASASLPFSLAKPAPFRIVSPFGR